MKLNISSLFRPPSPLPTTSRGGQTTSLDSNFPSIFDQDEERESPGEDTFAEPEPPLDPVSMTADKQYLSPFYSSSLGQYSSDRLEPAVSVGPLPPRRPPRRETDTLRPPFTPNVTANRKNATLSDSQTPGVLGMYDTALDTRHGNESNISLASRNKADQLLGLDSSANLASFYLVSGLPRVRGRLALGSDANTI